MEYDFETYKRQNRRSLSGLMITFAPNGVIRFSSAALEALGNPQRVVLLYDKEHKIIGVRNPERTEERDSFQVHRMLLGALYISAKAFVTYYDLDYGRTRRLPAFMQAGILCAPLSE